MSNLKIIGQKTVDKPSNTPFKFKGRAAVVTLGCAKNQVDSEVMLGVLRQRGYELVNDVARADVAIVNTCGFLESAVQEGLDCILDISELKTSGSLKKLIVAGCAVSRYQGDFKASLPEVDAFVSLNEILRVGEIADGANDSVLDGGRPYFLYDDSMPRELSGKKHSAYVKISEGCDRPCAFCIIPKIRGKMRSRDLTSVLAEVKALSLQGVKEINLVAQDLTDYGKDLVDVDISKLLKELDQLKAVNWIRLLYAYPLGINEKLLKTIVDTKSVCNYLDLPLQHASEKLLKRMHRPVGKYASQNIVEFIKKTTPEIDLRTTFIVGLPGETEQDVEELVKFVSQGHFTNVGVFTYSPEAGTPAAEMSDQIPEKEKNVRRKAVMQAQQAVVIERNKNYIGKEFPILLEDYHEDSDLLLVGRTEFQAPEVDGQVIVNDSDLDNLENYLGQFLRLAITECQGYDLIGKVLGKIDE